MYSALDIAIGVGLLVLLGLVVALYLKLASLERSRVAQHGELLEEKHRAMLRDLHEGLSSQADRVGAVLGESSERLRARVADELAQTRESVHALQLALAGNADRAITSPSRATPATTATRQGH